MRFSVFWILLETLYGLGILDKKGMVTRFGHLVLKHASFHEDKLLEELDTRVL